MKRTFKQFNIEKKSWNTYLEGKGYSKKKKDESCGCQHEDKSEENDSISFLEYFDTQEENSKN